MPKAESNGVRLHYEVSGSVGLPFLLLLNSLGSDLHMWDKVVPLLEDRFRVMRCDMRGHGRSEVAGEAFKVEQLGRDVLKLMDEVGENKVSICGVSLGGLVGLWLGIYAPDRVDRLILANSAARIGTRELWEQRVATVEASGMSALATATLERWFTSPYRATHPEEMNRIREMIAATDPQGYTSCCNVLRDTDLRASAVQVKAPTLVISATHDPATPSADGRALHDSIRGSSFLELNASHMPAWECADEFAGAIKKHLTAAGSMHG